MSHAHIKGETKRKTRQSETVAHERDRIVELVQDDLQTRDNPHQYFRGTDLRKYNEASIMQFVGHRPKPDWKKDYQYNVFEPITRDKVMAIISKGSGMYEAQFFNTNKLLAGHSETIATTLGAFYEDSRYNLNDVENNKALMLEALITVKAVWFEGWRHQTRIVRDIESRDEEGRPIYSEKKKVHYNGPWGQVVPVEEIIPGSIKIRDVAEQPRMSWVTRMSEIKFRREFPVKQYPNAALVETYQNLFDAGLTDLIVDARDMKDNEIEVVYCFEKWDDKLSIIANGVKLTRVNNPMPFAHKDYPFAWAGFEPFRSNFWADMPLPMKILDMQDMSNENFNLALDMTWRALNEVILVKSGDGINEDVLYGGGFVDVDDPANFNKMEFGSGFGFQAAGSMMDKARRAIESASLDAPQSGSQGTKPVTAREVLVAREAALEITSLFIQNLEALEERKALLRIQNQLDRYQRPVEWSEAIGEANAAKAIPVFREITARNTRLNEGKRGTAIIRITENPLTSQKELDKINDENSTEMSQTIDIHPDVIREIKPKVRIVANSSVKKSKSLERAEARQFFGDALAAPQIFNVKEAAKDYIEKSDKNPDDLLVKEQEVADPMAMFGGGGEPEKSPMIPPINDSVEEVLNTGG